MWTISKFIQEYNEVAKNILFISRRPFSSPGHFKAVSDNVFVYPNHPRSKDFSSSERFPWTPLCNIKLFFLLCLAKFHSLNESDMRPRREIKCLETRETQTHTEEEAFYHIADLVSKGFSLLSASPAICVSGCT